MGTNYYLRMPNCKVCKRNKEELHIGKSSGGYPFFLRIYEERGLDNWGEWVNFIKENHVKIFDEYDREVEKEEFIEKVNDLKKYINEPPFKRDSLEYPELYKIYDGIIYQNHDFC